MKIYPVTESDLPLNKANLTSRGWKSGGANEAITADGTVQSISFSDSEPDVRGEKCQKLIIWKHLLDRSRDLARTHGKSYLAKIIGKYIFLHVWVANCLRM